MTEIIYVYLKISLIQKFTNYVWFEVKLENDCFFSAAKLLAACL